MNEIEDTFEAGVKATKQPDDFVDMEHYATTMKAEADQHLDAVRAQLEAIAPNQSVRGIIIGVIRTSHCKCEAAQVLGIKKKELKLLMKSLDITWPS